jgi:hypothetical protein
LKEKISALNVQPDIIVPMGFSTILKNVTLATIVTLEHLNLLKMA